MNHPIWFRPVVTALVPFTFSIPILLFLWAFSRAPILDAESALSLLNNPAEKTLLVDVRSAAEFESMHVAGSVNLSVQEIAALKDLPVKFKGMTLILICNSGFQSAQATRRLLDLGASSVYSVRGGMQKWIGLSTSHAGSPFTQFTREGWESVPYRSMSMFEQVVVILSAFGFKPLHMILSSAIGFILLKQKSTDMRTLGWGMLIFLAAEIFCAINYIFYDHDSYLAEYLHNYGMTLSFSIVFFVILHMFDVRLVQFSVPDKRCMFLPLCKSCVKYQQTTCKLRSLFQVAAGAMMILAFIPMLAQPQATSYITQILGRTYHYCRLLLNQYFENLYLPLLALVFLLATLLIIHLDKSNPAPLLARIFMSGALGAFGFSLFRLALGSIFSQNLMWADFWEEATELMFVVLTGFILWIYRNSLLDSDVYLLTTPDVHQS